MSAPHFVTYPPLNTTPKRYMLFLFISGDKFDIKDYHHVFLSAGPMGLDTLEEAVDEYIENTLNKWTHERDTGSVRESRLASWSRDYYLIPLLIINTLGNHISPWFSIQLSFNSIQLSFNSIQLSLSGHLWIPAININLHDCKLNPQIAADARDINRYLWFKFHLQRSSRLLFIPVMCCYQTYFLYS